MRNLHCVQFSNVSDSPNLKSICKLICCRRKVTIYVYFLCMQCLFTRDD